MNDFKHSILTLMHASLDSRKITKVQYAPDQSLFPSYDELILSPHLFETESIFFIDESHQSSLVNSFCNSVSETYLFLQSKPLIKINNIETYNRTYIKFCNTLKTIFKATKIDCHLYFGKKNAPSFNFHKDPMAVLIGCLEGKKDIKFKKRSVSLEVNDWVYIPVNTHHKAQYPIDSVTLSIGIYK